jgi:hypothetical protein
MAETGDSCDQPLVTEGGKRVPPLAITPSLFLDRSLVIYGPAKTGKTVLTKHIMKVVNGYIEQAIIISPSESSNRSYEGYVDPPFIHYRLFLADPKNPKKDDGTKGALRFLEKVWQRQEMLASIYTRANNAEVLARLFGRLPKATRAEGLRYIGATNAKRNRVLDQVRRRYADEAGRRDEKSKEINEKFRKMLTLIYKRFLTPFYDELAAREDLSEDEQYSLHYLGLNPRLLLIFDDCAAEMKNVFNREIFRKLFYQNRHSYITVIICAQDDTDLPTNLRKNAFVSFFTDPIVCGANFERSSNNFPRPVKQYVAEISSLVYQGHRKLAYVREDDARQHFYYVQVPYPRPFHFGSAAFHELCGAVACEGTPMDKDNPFYERFRL